MINVTKEHKCEGITESEDVAIWDKGYYPNDWCLFSDYNVQVKINYCPFCGIKLEK